MYENLTSELHKILIDVRRLLTHCLFINSESYSNYRVKFKKTYSIRKSEDTRSYLVVYWYYIRFSRIVFLVIEYYCLQCDHHSKKNHSL